MKNIRRIIALVLCLCTLSSMMLLVNATEPTDETRGPEKAKPGIYDFVLEEQYVWIDRDRFVEKSPFGTMASRAMEAYYDDGTLNWLPVANNLGFMQSENVQASHATAFGGSDNYRWRGLRMGVSTKFNGKKSYPAGYWYAFKFKAPEPGVYDVKLDYMFRDDGAKVAEVYYLDSLYTDAILIDRELSQSTLISTVDFSGKSEDGKTYLPESTSLGKINVTEDEFTLVFRAEEKVSDNSCCYMVISGITLTPSDTLDPEPQINTPVRKNDMSLYLLIGGAAALSVAAVAVVVVVVGKKKKTKQ